MPNPNPNPNHPKPAAKTAGHDFKGLQDWIEVFKAGDHVDSKGRACSFSKADLDQMVSNVAALGKVPAVIGHPKSGAPAYAWGELKREGDILFAKFSDINPAFEAGVDSGAYRNRSISVYRDDKLGWRPRHIGWLGAEPPAIDGLKPLDYDYSKDTDAFDFAAGDHEAEVSLASAVLDMADLFTRLREWVIAEKGIEAADKVVPSWSLDWIKERATAAREAFRAERDQEGLNPQFSRRPQEDHSVSTITPEQLAQAQAAQKAAEDKLREFEAARAKSEVTSQVDGWIADGKLLPAQKDACVEFCLGLRDAKEFSFSKAGTQAKALPADFFAEFMAHAKPLVELGHRRADEDGNAGNAGLSDREIADRAHSFQKAQQEAGLTISIGTAIDAVKAGKDR